MKASKNAYQYHRNVARIIREISNHKAPDLTDEWTSEYVYACQEAGYVVGFIVERNELTGCLEGRAIKPRVTLNGLEYLRNKYMGTLKFWLPIFISAIVSLVVSLLG